MMDLTPLEVRKKKGDFRRQIRGYDPESVDDFLDLVADRMEALVRENAALTESSGTLEQRVSEYREREKALTEALVSAQQLREQMRATAVREADAARSQAEKDAHEHRSLAAQEAEQSRREARALLDQARAEAAEQIASARRSAAEEMERLRAELDRVREHESGVIRLLQGRRAELLESYRQLLEGEMAGLESLYTSVREDEVLSAEVDALAAEAPASAPVAELAVEDVVVVADVPDAVVAEAEAGDSDALPALSADLAALIEAAENDVELTWADAADENESNDDDVPGDETPADAEIIAAEEVAAEAELVLDEAEPDAGPAPEGDVDPEDLWLNELVEVAEAQTPTAAPRPAAEEDFANAADSDEDFLDGLIAEAGATTTRLPDEIADEVEVLATEPSEDAPALAELVDLEDDAEFLAGVIEAEAEVELEIEDANVLEIEVDDVLEMEAGDVLEVESAKTPEPIVAGPRPEVEPAIDPLVMLDEDEGFDALFEDGDDEGDEFDFDAALANATGFSGFPTESRNDAESAFDLGIELDDPGSPLDLGRAGAGSFGSPVRSAFSPSRPADLTLRPLSPEEEAPDLPAESRQRDETDDDMFSTMFHGR